MKHLLIACAVAYLTSAASFEVRPASDSRFALTVEKTGLYRGKQHLFLFERYQGSLQFDPARPTEAKLQLIIDSGSAVCKDDWVSAGDLKKVMQTTFEDMLAVQHYPSMTFASVAIRDLGGGKFEAQGTLTIRDIAKPVAVTVQLNAANPEQLRLDGSAKIRLTDYKLKPPSALLGAIGTKDEMTLNFTISAARVN
jgi:polyisoprenoid-binding protein YceI